MPTHDIIDNRDQRLVDHISRILGSTERARFAIPSFALSTPVLSVVEGSQGLFIPTHHPTIGSG